MPDREALKEPTGGPSARLLRALIWAGVSLAPVAAVVVVLLGATDAAERFAIVLIAACVVLIGASMLVRSDPVLLAMDVEDRVAAEVDALRDGLREEFAAAARATHHRVRAMQDETGRLRAAAVCPVPTGRGPAGPVPAGPVPAGPVPAGPVLAGPALAGSVPAGPVRAGSVPAGSLPAGSGVAAAGGRALTGAAVGGRAAVNSEGVSSRSAAAAPAPKAHGFRSGEAAARPVSSPLGQSGTAAQMPRQRGPGVSAPASVLRPPTIAQRRPGASPPGQYGTPRRPDDDMGYVGPPGYDGPPGHGGPLGYGDYDAPHHDRPDYGAPDHDGLDHGASDHGGSDYGASDCERPDYGASNYEGPDFGESHYESPDYGASDYTGPDHGASDGRGSDREYGDGSASRRSSAAGGGSVYGGSRHGGSRHGGAGTAGGYGDGAIYAGAAAYDEDAYDDAERYGDVGNDSDAGRRGDVGVHNDAGRYGDAADHSDAGGYGGSAGHGKRAGHGGTTYGTPGRVDSGPGEPTYGDGADYQGRYGERSARGKRRADITAIDLGYTGRRSRPDNRDDSGEFDYGPDAGYPGYSWEEPGHDPGSESHRKPRR
jgi:hypothetical protein